MFAPEFGFRGRNIQWRNLVVFSITCALVISIFARSAERGFLESASPRSQDAYYNLLVQGFRAGQLNVKRNAPPELAQLANPYDPVINTPFVWNSHSLLLDMSYYKGKLYLYFGVTPALVLFWPYAVLTRHYLPHKDAVVIFCVLGFLVGAGVVRAVWRRYFPEIKVWVMAAGILALGLVTGVPELLSRCDVWEVPIGCGFMFVMLALAAIWRTLHDPDRQTLWLGLASLAYGLAVGSRPSLMFGGIILLVPVVQAWSVATGPASYRRAGLLLLAAVGPLAAIGLGLMLYNHMRFDNPFEFGWHHQLATVYVSNTARQFSPCYLWVNFRFYFLEPMRWSGHFPFLQPVPLFPLPSGYFGTGEPYCGILGDYPLVWLALASPLAWRGRQRGEASGLRWFVVAVFLLFVVCALTVCFFFTASARYEVDFLPALMLLAVIGVFGIERSLAGSPWRVIVRLGWCLLLVYSLVFNLLASVEAHAGANYSLGNYFLNNERTGEATKHFRRAVAIQPECATFRIGLGRALCEQGQTREALVQYQEAIAREPGSAQAYNGLGKALFQSGDVDGAIAQYEKALKIKPDFADPHINLGYILLQEGRINGAITQYQAAVTLLPQSTRVHNDLGYCLLQAGRVDEAIEQFRKALDIHPNNYSALYSLGYALHRKRMAAEAIVCYHKVIELYPKSAPARVELAWILATWPEPSVRNGPEAVALASEAQALCRGDNPVILRTLAAAYAEAGRFSEAVAAAKQALAVAMTQSAAGLTNALQKELELYQTNSPCRSAVE
jgi:Flp pilus assembly protein TadD